MHSELSYGLSFAPKLQRVEIIDLSGSHQPTPDPSFSPLSLPGTKAKSFEQKQVKVLEV